MKINDYHTPENSHSTAASLLPTPFFYLNATRVVFRAAGLAKKGLYDDERWIQDSCLIISLLEKTGCRLHVTGRNNFAQSSYPRVFVANHMSTLETFALPCLLNGEKKLTYVVKKELVDYPVFKHIMRSRDPVVVGRSNPRDDFKTVMQEGTRRLKQGTSIIIFPQTTRSRRFDPEQFNSMGVKLAKRAEVPVVPVALKTDAWSTGRLLKDYGRIRPSRDVYFGFDSPMTVSGNGKKEHERCMEFISDRIDKWNRT